MRYIFTELKIAILSWRFACAVMATTVTLFLCSATAFQWSKGDVFYYLTLSISGTGFLLLGLFILPALPVASAFPNLWKNHAERFWIIRTGIDKFVCGKVVSSFVVGGLVPALGIALYVFILSFFKSFKPIDSNGDFYTTILAPYGKGTPILLCYAAHYFLSGALTSCLSLLTAALVLNDFGVVMLPSCFYLLLLKLSTPLGLNKYFYLPDLIEGVGDSAHGIAGLLGTKLIITMILCGLMTSAMHKILRRRVLNG